MEERKETLAKLYAIRAGMSAVVQKRQEAEQHFSQVKSSKQLMDNNNFTLRKSVPLRRDELEKLREQQRRGCCVAPKVSKKKYVGAAFVRILGTLLLAFGALVCGHWFVLNWFTDFDYNAHGFAKFLLGLWSFLSPLLALSFAGCMIIPIMAIQKIINDYKLEVRIAANRNEKWQKEYADLPRQIEKLEQEIIYIEKKCQADGERFAQDMNQSKIAAQQTQKESAALCWLLDKEFSSVLDVRDWGNVDLVIYYFETGRADTVKEALQQVDRQRQADAIVQAIHDAGDYICGTIQRGLQELNHNMVKCFSVISTQLESISAAQNAQNELIARQNQGIAELSKKVDLGNSLQAMRNISSQELAKDVARIRQLGEYREMRRRNGI